MNEHRKYSLFFALIAVTFIATPFLTVLFADGSLSRFVVLRAVLSATEWDFLLVFVGSGLCAALVAVVLWRLAPQSPYAPMWVIGVPLVLSLVLLLFGWIVPGVMLAVPAIAMLHVRAKATDAVVP